MLSKEEIELEYKDAFKAFKDTCKKFRNAPNDPGKAGEVAEAMSLLIHWNTQLWVLNQQK